MRAPGYLISLFLVLLLFYGPGCRRSSEGPSRQPARLARTAPTWGPAAEGLQCRLRPTRRLWPAGKPLVFKLDLRNQGKRLFAFDTSEPTAADRISIDGRWYPWPAQEPDTAKIRPFAPGDELADLTLTLAQTPRLPLTPGYHTIRAALVFEGVNVVSNPADIEIAPPRSSP